MPYVPDGMTLGGKHRDRVVEPAPTDDVFYSFGGTWRGEYELKAAGWYFVHAGNLHGPYAKKDQARAVMVSAP